MPESDFAAVQFIPWVRQGIADMADGGTVHVQFKVNAEDVTMPIRLLGPGTVTGIDPKQVIRMEPRPGTTDFTPYNFPAVEFDRPEFPWLFSPLPRDGNDRIRPWLCLVAIRKQAGVTLQFDQGAPLAKLEIKDPAKPGRELPDLEESWAWAHAQVVGRSGASTPEEGLADAALNLSRLVCPRKLEPDTDYIACVVPAFETGRRAGLGLALDGAGELTPAWQINGSEPANITLPVYHHWEFRAGAPVDFESLVRLLKARPLPEKAGKRDLWIGNAGLGLPQMPPEAEGAVISIQGALKPPDSHAGEWPPVSREPFRNQLRAVVNSPADALEQGAVDPVVAPPIYGRWHAGKSRVELSGGDPPWLHELNLDPRYRAAAGLGAEAIRRDQESLMAAAWEQVGEIQQANQLLRRAQVARAVTTSIHSRHFGRMPEATLVDVTAPAHPRLRAVPLPDGPPVTLTLTLRGEIARSTTTALPVPMRKVIRPRGPISRKADRPRTDINVTAIPQSTNMITIEGLTDAIFVTQPEIKAKVRSLGASPSTFDPVPPRPGFVWVFTLQAEGGPLIFGHWERQRAGEQPGHRPVFLNFRSSAAAHEERIPRPRSIEFDNKFTLGSLSAAILGQLNPATTIASRVKGRIQMKIASFAGQTGDSLSPIMAAPEFPRPMYEALRDISPDFLLPGLEHVLPNTATLVQTNPEFVEAFMTGLSTEMARELLWREFPTDQRGTYFRQFWDAVKDSDRRQIQSIHEWKDSLGKNAEPGHREASIVLLIRGELLRRYPHTVIYAKKAVLSGTRRVPGGAEKYPLFRGSLEPDVTFLGFDLSKKEALGDGVDQGWFFVLQEQPTAPRFGLDKAAGFADTIAKATKWSDLSWGHVAANQAAFETLTHVPASGALPDTSGISEPPGTVWGKNSAHLAYATFQQPVRIAIHASDMISTETEVRA